MKKYILILILLFPCLAKSQNNLTYDQVVDISNNKKLEGITKQLITSMGFDSIVRIEIKNHPKGLGEDFLVFMPHSWKRGEGLRPHIVSVFNFKTNSPSLPIGIATLYIRKFDRPYSKSEIKSTYTEATLSEMYQKNSTDFKLTQLSYDNNIDGFNTIIHEVTFTRSNMGKTLVFFSRSYYLFKNNILIILSYSLSGLKENENYILPIYANSRKYFDYMAQNFVLLSQWY